MTRRDEGLWCCLHTITRLGIVIGNNLALTVVDKVCDRGEAVDVVWCIQRGVSSMLYTNTFPENYTFPYAFMKKLNLVVRKSRLKILSAWSHNSVGWCIYPVGSSGARHTDLNIGVRPFKRGLQLEFA